MKSIDSHIELLKEQFNSVGTKFNGLTWNRIKDSLESYAQQYVDANKELVEMLERVEPMLRERHLYATAADVRELLFKHTTHDKGKEESC